MNAYMILRHLINFVEYFSYLDHTPQLSIIPTVTQKQSKHQKRLKKHNKLLWEDTCQVPKDSKTIDHHS